VREKSAAYFNSPLSPMVMPPGPAFFLASTILRVSIALVRHSSALATSSLRAASLPIVQIGLAPVHQVQVGHGLVIIGPVVIRLGEVLQAFLDQRSILAL
jgi:hypothetical protein